MIEPIEEIRERGGKRKELPPLEYIRECLDYDPDTGELRWRKRPRHHFSSDRGMNIWNARYPGTVAGSRLAYWQNGTQRPVMISFRMGIKDKSPAHQATAVIFAIIGREIPDGFQIDHKDCDNRNNRLDNLRLTTPHENSCNTRGHRNKRSGLPKGVYRHENKFVANIMSNGKYISLGRFSDPQEAAQAYRDAAKKLHGEFARFG